MKSGSLKPTSRARLAGGGGSGLGLSIARKIVDMHQGSISLASRPGKGTAFTVRLSIGGVHS